MSPWVFARWQMVHEIVMAECTDLPLVLSAWQTEQTSSLWRTPGCSTAAAGSAVSRRRREAVTVLRIGLRDSSQLGVRDHYWESTRRARKDAESATTPLISRLN